MEKTHLLQAGVYPDRDEIPLYRDFIVHRYSEAADKPAFPAAVGPLVRAIATRGDFPCQQVND